MSNEPKPEETKKANAPKAEASPAIPKKDLPECFVIMPISDPEEYEDGHFKSVYWDLFRPACQMAGFLPVRADEIKQGNFIQLDILQRLLQAPMAICDLSSTNPNVMYELGVRQAFDKPVALVQEEGTRQIFDISPIRYEKYKRSLVYRDVVQAQNRIAELIKLTFEAHSDKSTVTSLVKLLSLSQPAVLEQVSDTDKEIVQLVRSEIASLRDVVSNLANNQSRYSRSAFSVRSKKLDKFNAEDWNVRWPGFRKDIFANIEPQISRWVSNSEIKYVDDTIVDIVAYVQDPPSDSVRQFLIGRLSNAFQRDVQLRFIEAPSN